MALVSAWEILIARRETAAFYSSRTVAHFRQSTGRCASPNDTHSSSQGLEGFSRLFIDRQRRRRTAGHERHPGIRRRVFHPDPLVIRSELHRWIRRIARLQAPQTPPSATPSNPRTRVRSQRHLVRYQRYTAFSNDAFTSLLGSASASGDLAYLTTFLT